MHLLNNSFLNSVPNISRISPLHFVNFVNLFVEEVQFDDVTQLPEVLIYEHFRVTEFSRVQYVTFIVITINDSEHSFYSTLFMGRHTVWE